MRLSWYGDTGIAVFSIWQNGTCTGTFRLPIAELPRMAAALQRGPELPPGSRPEQADWQDQADWPEEQGWQDQADWPEQQPGWPEQQPGWPEQADWPEPDWAEQANSPAQPGWQGQPDRRAEPYHGAYPPEPPETAPQRSGRPGEERYQAGQGGYPGNSAGRGYASRTPSYLPVSSEPPDGPGSGYLPDRRGADYPAPYQQAARADYAHDLATPVYQQSAAAAYGDAGYYPPAFPGDYPDSVTTAHHETDDRTSGTRPRAP